MEPLSEGPSEIAGLVPVKLGLILRIQPESINCKPPASFSPGRAGYHRDIRTERCWVNKGKTADNGQQLSSVPTGQSLDPLSGTQRLPEYTASHYCLAQQLCQEMYSHSLYLLKPHYFHK